MRFPEWTFSEYTFYRNAQIPKDISRKPTARRTFCILVFIIFLFFHIFFIFIIFFKFLCFFLIFSWILLVFYDFFFIFSWFFFIFSWVTLGSVGVFFFFKHVSCFCFYLLHFAALRDARVQYDVSHYEKLLDLRDARVHYHIRFARCVLFISRAVHETCFCCRSCNGSFFFLIFLVKSIFRKCQFSNWFLGFVCFCKKYIWGMSIRGYGAIHRLPWNQKFHTVVRQKFIFARTEQRLIWKCTASHCSQLLSHSTIHFLKAVTGVFNKIQHWGRRRRECKPG